MDWLRLQKALAVEAERGFNDLVGNQYRFSEFLCLHLGQPPIDLDAEQQQQWQQRASDFATYSQLSFAERQHLVADTRRLIYQAKRSLESPPSLAEMRSEEGGTRSEEGGTLQRSNVPTPKTLPVDHRHQVHHLRLDQPVTYLPGVGPKNSERLGKLGLFTVRDLLFYYPRDHINYARQVPIQDLLLGETVTIIAKVMRCNCFSTPKNNKLTIFELKLKDKTGMIKLTRFYPGDRYRNRGWQEQQKRRYPPGAVVAASGLVKQNKYGITLDDPQIEVLDHEGGTIDSIKVGRMVPVYALSEGVAADLVRKTVVAALPAVAQLVDALPEAVRSQYELVDLPEAIAQVHFPDSEETLAAARRRLIFDEFFYLQLGLLKRRQEQRQHYTNAVLAPTGELIDRFYEVLPFALTGAQQRVVNDILSDLQTNIPMNRLVQGDVGSGKTVVGVVAILAAIQSGFQAALMAPTEVLAEQHYRKLVEWFNLLHLPVELLTGSTTNSKRKQIHTELATGELPLLVGTHALIEDPVQFQQLGLVVIDEQHRFGVAQRARLQQKGNNPHVLTMTATPIPRTLALTLHGDLDVSQIDELPPGRKPIKTTILSGRDRQHAYDLIRREMVQGRQVYVVLPLVEESEKLDLRSAIDEHQRLQDTIFPDFRVGLVHGRMGSAEKDQAIAEFRDRQTHILVSTTVVEVGVDVPNATVMLIEHAERFGLAQLHQLRGRVGRGGEQSFCLLMNNSKNEVALQRLKVLEQSQDGFFISEMDMRFRGPGEVLGKRQSGLPDFALASLVNDQDVLALARDAAESLIETDPTLAQWEPLKAELDYRYQRLMGGAILT
ncbi:MAG: ATP-dependent DNA helicase RecG [Leptolyngbyaceae bacterium]|nr:ATP-dependent DNA helicase RecG [Leptolyngbyaceae bacterium]